MSLKFLNEGFELSQFNVLQENVVKQITSILNTLNEATMSDEDRRDSKLLRQILSKASDASYDKRRALKWTPQELEIADKYNRDEASVSRSMKEFLKKLKLINRLP